MEILEGSKVFGTVMLSLMLSAAVSGQRAHAQPVSEDSLKAAIEAVAAQHPEATIGVVVRDAATGTNVEINADRRFHAASTMKVPVMIELFRQAEEGHLLLDDAIEVRNRFRSIVDGSTYQIEDDSDDDLYERLGTEMTLQALNERMITVSSNLATNLLIEVVTPDSVQQTLQRLGAERMQVLRGVEDLKAYRQDLNNTATARDLAMLLEALRQGQAVSPEADQEMVEVLEKQHFDDMIPEGLPEGAHAAHKTGWITGVHHDAAIVYPESGEAYVLVILTEGIEDEEQSAELGAEITRTVHRALREGS